MHKLHPLKISSIEKNTPETALLTFEVPETLKKEFSYTQGQHLTLRHDIGGEDLRRSYSICSSVAENCLKVAVRAVEGGRFSTFVNEELAAGDTLDVMAPAGHFYVDLAPENTRTYIAFASGSGITPIMSIIKTTLESEPNARFMLFYGNKTARSTIFRNEISMMKNRYLDRFSYWHFLTQEDLELDFFKGRLDGDKVRALSKSLIDVDQVDHAFICGPEAMIDSVSEALIEIGMDKNAVHFEKFLSEGQTPVASKRVGDAGGTAKMTLIIDGDEFNIQADRKTAILDAALNEGADVPFACKGGVCCTCRAKVLKGDVDMVLNQGLEPEEVDAGYVLTCQSFAVSDDVVLSYDE